MADHNSKGVDWINHDSKRVDCHYSRLDGDGYHFRIPCGCDGYSWIDHDDNDCRIF